MIIETILEFNKELNQNGAHDWSDRLTVLVMGIIFVGGAIVTYKFTVNSPFVCFSAVTPSGDKFLDFASNYVWTHGSMPTSALKDTRVMKTADWTTMYKESGIFYYQWIPVLFLLMFLVLYLCRKYWQRVCSTNASYSIDSLLSDCNTATYRNEKQESHISMNLLAMITKKHHNSSLLANIRHVVQEKLKCLACSRTLGSWHFANYIIFKVITIAMCLVIPLMIRTMFRINLTTLVNMWTTGTAINDRFPRSVVALVPYVVDVEDRNNYMVHCVTSVNIISEKLFPILMFLFLMLALANVVSLVSWIVMIGSRAAMIKFVKKYLKRINQNIDKEKLKEFVVECLHWDGVFLLKMMDNNCDPWLVRIIVARMWNTFMSEQLSEVIADVPQ